MNYSKLMMTDLIALSMNEAFENKSVSKEKATNLNKSEINALIDNASKIFINYVKEGYEKVKFEQALVEELDLYNEIETVFSKAFSLLRIFIDLNRSAGNLVLRHYEFESASENRNKMLFVFRFHGMILKNAEAISILLQNGFSNEALGRWRTMHELSAVMLTLLKQSTKTIKMYQEHGAIEKFREMNEFQKNCHLLNLRPLKEKDMQTIEFEKNELIKKYGKEFGEANGWAIEILPKHQRNIRGMEKVAEVDCMRSFYMHAGQSIHAGIDGVDSYINNFNYKDFFKFSKPSSFGISQPASFCCWTLMTTTSRCLELTSQAEFIMLKHSLEILYTETCEAFKTPGNLHDKEKFGEKSYFEE